MKYCFLAISLFLGAVFSTAGSGPVNLFSAGSTFIFPILGKWCEEYRRIHPEVQISYDPVGSGHGIAQMLARTVDFGASDGPLSDFQIQHARFKVIHFPVVLGGVVPAYNLPGVSQELRFTAAALAGIYLGAVTNWNDPELVRANPSVVLPARSIQVIYRADSSGTTYVWTDYLSKVSPEWNKRIGTGTSVKFPVGEGAQFNEGVRNLIKQKPYSFGYLQSTYAIQGHLQSGPVQNAAGNFVKGDSPGITAAAAATSMPDDFRVSITDSGEAPAYPVSSYTWLLVPERVQDPAKRQAIAGFLRWVLTDGQRYATPVGYSPLPPDLASKVVKAVDRIR